MADYNCEDSDISSVQSDDDTVALTTNPQVSVAHIDGLMKYQHHDSDICNVLYVNMAEVLLPI